jgi:uncharacterized protein (TIGR02246 family)
MNARKITVVALVWALSLVGMYWWASRRDTMTLQQDLVEIEKLRQREIAATLSQDPAALADLWTDDVVRIGPGQPAEVGKQAVLDSNARQREAAPGLKALTYVPAAKEVIVTSDGWAFEWGTFTATFVLAPGAEVQTMKAHRMLIYRKQPEGTWKAARGMTAPAG